MKKNILFICLLVLFTGCDSFLDLKPIDYPVEDNFYSDVKGLEGALIGAYDELQSTDQYGAKNSPRFSSFRNKTSPRFEMDRDFPFMFYPFFPRNRNSNRCFS